VCWQGGLRQIGVVFELAAKLFEHSLCGTHGLVGAEFGGWGEESVLGVVGDLGDDLGGRLVGAGLGQVEAGDLQAVEKQAGAAWIDVVGGDFLEYLA